MSLNGKIAVVTGGSSGIGFAVAQELIAQGAKVVIAGRRQAQLEEAVTLLGAQASFKQVDVAKQADLDALYADVRAKHGKLDIVVANAGVGDIAPLGQITEEHIDKALNTNIKGVIYTVQQALPLLGAGSSVVIIGSTASIDPGPGLSVYGGVKAALRNMVRSWIQDIKGSGVRLNLLSPGPVNTASLRGMLGDNADEILGYLAGKSFIGRIGEAEEIARAVAFLASDAASYIHGAELFADGGASQI